MGRKIPGKKHRTIKDPYKQREKRIDSQQINNPPSNCDDQEIPKSLKKIMQLKETAKLQTFKRKKKKKKNTLLSVEDMLDHDEIQPGMTKPDGYIPKLVQKPNESDERFIRRVHFMTQNLISEVEFEKKFKVKVNRNPETGQVIEVLNMKRKNPKSKKKKLSVKRKEKMLAKNENEKNLKDFSQLKDNVEFGEVVHAPPNLKAPKKIVENNIQKPRYSNLLLNNLGKNNEIKVKNTLTSLEKQRAENERKFIVEAYRKIKKNI